MNIPQIYSPVHPLHVHPSSTSRSEVHPVGRKRIIRGKRTAEWVYPEWARGKASQTALRVTAQRLPVRLVLRLLGLGNGRTTVPAVVDALASPSWLRRKSIDDLSPLRMSIPVSGLEVSTYLGSYCNTQKVYEPDILVPDDLHLVDKPKPTHIVSELLHCRTLVQSAKVQISARVALLDRQLHLSAHRGRLPPANLELLPVQRQLLDCCVKGSSSAGIKERQKYIRLLGENADRLKWSKMNEI